MAILLWADDCCNRWLQINSLLVQEEHEGALAAARAFYSLAASGQEADSDAAPAIPEGLGDDLCGLIRQTQAETEATIGKSNVSHSFLRLPGHGTSSCIPDSGCQLRVRG